MFRGFHTSAKRYSTQEQELKSTKEVTEPRPFSDIPDSNPNKIRGLITTIRRRKDAHIVMKERHDVYGPIFRNKMGPFNMLFISDPDAIENFFRQEEKFPERIEFGPWLAQWKDLGQQFGLVLR